LGAGKVLAVNPDPHSPLVIRALKGATGKGPPACPPKTRRTRVAVFAPSGAVREEDLARGLRCLEAWGFRYEVSPEVFSRHHYLAGKDALRANFLVEKLLSDTCEVLWAARGGYGSLRLLPYLEKALIKITRPCLLIGFSDVSILLNFFATRLGFPCLHAPVLTTLLDTNREALLALRRVLLEGDGILLCGECWREGEVTGPLLGGNLASLVSLLGTPWFPDLQGKILFLEEVNEPTYRVDRLFTQLALAGKLQEVAGLVLGSFVGVDMERLKELVLEVFQGGPVIAGLPCGHTPENFPLFIGVETKLEAFSRRGILRQEPLGPA